MVQSNKISGVAALERFVSRYRKVEELRQKLANGKAVELRELKAVLGEAAVKRFEEDWQAEKDMRSQLTDKPQAIRDYEQKLRKADLAYGRAAQTTRKTTTKKGKQRASVSSGNLHDKAESLYERALERLQEILHEDASLVTWFDREISFEQGQEPYPVAESMPRVRTSRSENAQTHAFSKNFTSVVAPTFASASKADIKKRLIDEELEEMSGTIERLDAVFAEVEAEKGKNEREDNDKVAAKLARLLAKRR